MIKLQSAARMKTAPLAAILLVIFCFSEVQSDCTLWTPWSSCIGGTQKRERFACKQNQEKPCDPGPNPCGSCPPGCHIDPSGPNPHCTCECSPSVGPPPGCCKLLECDARIKSWKCFVWCGSTNNGCPGGYNPIGPIPPFGKGK